MLYCVEETVYLATTYIMYVNTLSFSRFYPFEAIKCIEYTLNCTFFGSDPSAFKMSIDSLALKIGSAVQ